MYCSFSFGIALSRITIFSSFKMYCKAKLFMIFNVPKHHDEWNAVCYLFSAAMMLLSIAAIMLERAVDGKQNVEEAVTSVVHPASCTPKLGLLGRSASDTSTFLPFSIISASLAVVSLR